MEYSKIGVLEWWSNGVLGLAITPTLQYSIIPAF
jgi:hypothetical protein